MPLSQEQHTPMDTLTALYIDALRHGEALWFRVTSGSMTPILHVGDEVRIEPASAAAIRTGEIAAFETAEGLVIHRIVRRQQSGTAVRLVEMSDVRLYPGWIDGQSIIGRVILARHDTHLINLQHPIAQMCSTVTALLRYRLYYLYTLNTFKLWRMFLHTSSRLVVFAGDWCIRKCSAS